jgi:apolipoprotein N-acyltransferase
MTQSDGRPFWQGLCAVLVLGLVAAFGLAPLYLWPATVVSFFLLPSVVRIAHTNGQMAVLGWGFGTAYFAQGLLWIVEPFLIDPERHAWMAPFALLFMSAGLALFWAAAFWGAARLARAPEGRIWALIATLSLAEFARAYVLTGFPWAGLAQVWVDTTAAQMLAWGGPHWVALLSTGAAMAAGQLLVSPPSMRRTVLGLLPAICFVGGGYVADHLQPETSETGKVVRLIQPNAPQHQKWDPDYVWQFFERQLVLTAQGDRPDLIVWPETSVPQWLSNADPLLQQVAVAAGGTPVALGIRRADGPRIFNSLLYLDETGAQASVYDKHHLVPFGEYVPFGDVLAKFGIYGFAANAGQGFSAGIGPALVSVGELGKALPLICYEAVFPQDLNNAPERANFILQITNDAWFGARSGPYQHLAQARMRAIEQGLPLLRAANTGVSAVIDPRGRVTESLPLGISGSLDGSLPAPFPPTFYARYGDLPVFILSVLALLTVTLLQGLPRRNK